MKHEYEKDVYKHARSGTSSQKITLQVHGFSLTTATLTSSLTTFGCSRNLLF